MKRHASVIWNGSLTKGSGRLESTQSGALGGLPLSFKARFEDETGRSGTNPEELIAAAHAACFSMQLAHMLAEGGTPAESLDVKAEIDLQPKQGGGFEIRGSALTVNGTVPGMEEAKFKEIAAKAKEICPVSAALKAIPITLEARFA
ncbi:OsmC family protein [Chelativorans sp. SCAU2101]|jgi:peroxiredoxin, OsmC subfamily|uniref:OsmC family protein n=1 Tax=Chelativorans petroleitrophicus TaxID=2975484 RepID=A0A9X2X5V8_9HYPH|nr:OsmC family protein [Chelativorans petroleitrophicus]MCT8988736.1 OsmC family protein [Chelativorans petroleitrophicus]